MAKAKAWSLRCQLELQKHPSAVFTTLTYSNENLPPTLDKRHLQLWLKRLRKAVDAKLRFFASGEYGERTARAHYHAIVYNLRVDAADRIDKTWGLGHTHTVQVTPAAISYVAGYTSKKVGYKLMAADERVDPSTGEVYTWQPPFIQMSRNPGIGGDARHEYTQSWRLYAVQNGYRMPVPRYLHDAWKAQATPLEQEELLYEKSQLSRKAQSETALQAAEHIALAKQALSASRRKL